MTVIINQNETKYLQFKHYFTLFLPIALMTFSTHLFPTVEKVILATLSKENMEASLSAFYAVQIFQVATVSLAMMSQVFVGRWYGEKKWNLIGPGIWQFIWFSLFSLLITFPCGYFYGKFYFKATAIEGIVFPYYYSLLAMSFLFPLGGTLTCFFLGRGKTILVFIVTLISHFIKIPLGYAFIIGWKKFPSLGLMGGALSIFITQLVFCLTLFLIFLRKKNHALYQTREWKFNWTLFWECIQPGFLRAINRILTMTNWGAVTYLLTRGAEQNLLVLSIGGTLILFTSFFGEAICLTQMTVVSQILGTKRFDTLHTAFRPGLILAIIATILLSINLLAFPGWTFSMIFPQIHLEPSAINTILKGVWLTSVFCIFSYLPISYVLAFKDTYFSLFMGFINWITGFVFIYIFLDVVGVSPNYFWILFSFLHLATALLYFLRTKRLIDKSRLANHSLFRVESRA